MFVLKALLLFFVDDALIVSLSLFVHVPGWVAFGVNTTLVTYEVVHTAHKTNNTVKGVLGI